jgi:hypothetical protein
LRAAAREGANSTHRALIPSWLRQDRSCGRHALALLLPQDESVRPDKAGIDSQTLSLLPIAPILLFLQILLAFSLLTCYFFHELHFGIINRNTESATSFRKNF